MNIDVFKAVIIGCTTAIIKAIITRICNRFDREEAKRDVKIIATPAPKRKLISHKEI